MISGLQFSSNGRQFTAVEAEELADPHDGYLTEVRAHSGEDVYFFSDDAAKDGSRKSGLQTISFEDGDFQFYFLNNGKAAHGYVAKIKKYVNHGVVLAADNDTSNYGYVKYDTNVNKLDSTVDLVDYYEDTVPGGNNAPASSVLVNANGTVQKGKFNLKDINDVYYVTDKQGRVEYASYKKLYTTKNDDHNHPITVGGKPYFTE